MGITVERLYRVRIGDTPHLLGGDEALDQVKGLVTALGLSPQSHVGLHVDGTDGTSDHTPISADISPPTQLPSGPVAEQTDNPPPVETAAAPAEAAKGRAVVAWAQADTDRLRALAAEGLTGPQIAAAMGKPRSTVYGKAGQHRIAIGAKHEAAPIAAPAPPPVADDAWTDAQSRYLVELMTRPSASIQYATTCCGHSFVQTSKRWSALKAAGVASVAEWDQRHAGVEA